MATAYEYFNGDPRFNCSESILIANVSDEDAALVRIGTPFGGGVGGAGEMCGALIAGLMIMGYRKGRTDASGPKDVYQDGKAMLAAFKEKFGTVSCADLNFLDYKSPEHLPRCSVFVKFVDEYLKA